MTVVDLYLVSIRGSERKEGLGDVSQAKCVKI